ncbi:MAG: right-handed parallel beta-helix repeat-containing protein, partial [bacterium]|nr:right-handed parallel beta-helix repeat-containing protein [bacterium]
MTTTPLTDIRSDQPRWRREPERSCQAQALGTLHSNRVLVAGLVAILLPTGLARAQSTLYVDDDAPAGGDGANWATAIDDLQHALTLAAGGGISRIHIAQGTYRPDEAGLDRDATFQLRNGLLIRGGYGGLTAADPDARDLDTYESVLSGNLGGDGPPHSRHVVTGSGTDSSAVLDGFTVTGGRAKGGVIQPGSLSGGGMVNVSGSPTVIDCVFRDNRAEFFGGAVANFGEYYLTPIEASPTLIRCRFERNGNTPTVTGGALSNFLGCSPILIDCSFIENTAGEGAGAIMNLHASPFMVNCTFAGNWAVGPDGIAGAMFNGSSLPTMINCLFVGNRSDCPDPIVGGGGAVWMDSSGTPPMINCSFVANTAASAGGGIYYQGGGPTLANCILWGNTDQGGTNSDASAQIYNVDFDHYDAVVSYSIVQDDAPGDGDVYPGPGNTDLDPVFVLYPDDGGDGWGVGFNDDYGDLHLSPGSPAVDSGDNEAVPDEIETDLDSRPRFANDPDSPDVGHGTPPIVDLGVYEFDTDCNQNGVIDADDIANGTSADSNGNGVPDECEACLVDNDCDDGDFCNGVEFCAAAVCWNGLPPCEVGLCNETDDDCYECAVDDDCDNGRFCDGLEVCSGHSCLSGSPPCPDQFCNENGDRCVDCLDDSHCDDGAFCTGIERCEAGECSTGQPPCGDLFCDETSDRCTGCLDDADCDDGLYCSGVETCDGDTCVPGADPCPGLICVESTDSCTECTAHADCDDGQFCNGAEVCSGGSCLAGTPPCPGPLCDEDADRCAECSDDAHCDDGLFCNGTERCLAGTCSAGQPPCGELLCDEDNDRCAACLANVDCDDGLFCNGAETCSDGACGSGGDPCPGLACVETSHSCIECTNDADCSDDLFCNGIERCLAGVCLDGDEPCSDYAPFCNEALNICGMCLTPGDCDDGNPCSTDVCIDGFCGYLADPTCGGDDGRSAADADSDGISDADDHCPDTPVGQRANDRGCSCSQRDGDGDGIVDCDDRCPYTEAGDSIDEDGCSVPPPPDYGPPDPPERPDDEGMVTIDIDPGTLETGGSADGDDPSDHLGEAEANAPEERPVDDGQDASTRPAGRSTCGVLGSLPVMVLCLGWFPLRRTRRTNAILLAGLVAILLPTGLARAQSTLYVDDDAPAGGDGASWATAIDDLQHALTLAASGGISRIHVAQGTYRPDEAGLDRDATFQLQNGLAIRGGYGGLTAPDPDARDLTAYESILSGNLNGDSGPHSRHVVTGSGTNSSAVLDGFTVTGGRATGGEPYGHRLSGGGMINVLGSPTVIDCIFRENRANIFGGAMANFGNDQPPYNGSSPTLVRCSFERNAAMSTGGAGAMANVDFSNPILIDCSFTENTAGDGVGAMMNLTYCNPVLVNCTFKGNWAPGPWGIAAAMFNGGWCSPAIINCAFVGNRSDSDSRDGGGGAIWMDSGCAPLIVNCSFGSNAANSDGGAIYNQSGHPVLGNCIFWGNTDQGGTNGDASAQIYNAYDGVAVVSYSIVQDDAPGDGDVYPGIGNLDLDPQFQGVVMNDFHLRPGSPCIDMGDPSHALDDLGTRIEMGGFAHVPGYQPEPGVYCERASYYVLPT